MHKESPPWRRQRRPGSFAATATQALTPRHKLAHPSLTAGPKRHPFCPAPHGHSDAGSLLAISDEAVDAFDTRHAGEPKLLRTVPLYGYPQSFSGGANTVLFALGMNGMQRIEL